MGRASISKGPWVQSGTEEPECDNAHLFLNCRGPTASLTRDRGLGGGAENGQVCDRLISSVVPELDAGRAMAEKLLSSHSPSPAFSHCTIRKLSPRIN